MHSVAVTDHGNMFGAIEFYTEARKAGIKPIIGCEAYVAGASRHERSPSTKYPDGGFHRDDAVFDEQAYLDALQGVAVHEVSGRIDFAALTERCLNELLV